MDEILPGVFHWTTHHEPIGMDVSSYLVRKAGLAIDPKVPEAGFDALPFEPSAIVLTTGLHDRDAKAFADHFGIPIKVGAAAAERIGDDFDVEVVDDGAEVAPRVTLRRIGELSDDEHVLVLDVAVGALSFADGLTRIGGEIAFVPDSLMGDDPEAVKSGLKERFAELLDIPFDALLFAHGDPLPDGGKNALRAFVSE